MVADIIAHLETLQENCNSISPKTTMPNLTGSYPFWGEPRQINELRLKESSIDLTEDSSMKDSFKENFLINSGFEVKLSSQCSFVKLCNLFLMPLFCNKLGYMCESGFSELLF